MNILNGARYHRRRTAMDICNTRTDNAHNMVTRHARRVTEPEVAQFIYPQSLVIGMLCNPENGSVSF